MTGVDWGLLVLLLAGWAGRETLFHWRQRSKRRGRS
jgi:hypothetical protein